MTETTLISIKVSQGKVSQGKSLFSGFATIHVPFSEDDSLPCSGGQPRLWRQDQGREGTGHFLRGGRFLPGALRQSLERVIPSGWAHCSNPSGFFLHTYERELILPDRAFLI